MPPSPQIKWLIDIFQTKPQAETVANVEKIKLSQLVSKLGFFYEKFRNVIDYHEEHLVRRNSLRRSLKRQILFLQEKRSAKIGKTLIYEFIRASYLPNNELPETIIDEVAKILEKYLTIFSYVLSQQLPQSKKINQWLIGLLACEIDEYLFPVPTDTAMVNFMYSHLVANLTFLQTEIEEKEKNLQIYLAVLKTLARADNDILNYSLLKLYLPNWLKADESEIKNFCLNLRLIKNRLDRHLKHRLGFQLTRVIRPQAVFFNVLKNLMEKNKADLNNIFNNSDLLEDKIEELALFNYQITHRKLIGTIFRVIIYILLTKTILAFIFELPYDWFVLKQINWLVLFINVIFHPLLMLLIALTIKVPGAKNTQIIVQEIKKIVAGEERKILFKAKRIMERRLFSQLALNAVYLIMFAVSFGLVWGVLKTLRFNLISGILFVFFLTIVSFFGFRLRALAKQYSVIPRKENFINFLVDFLSLPIIRVGRFIATNFAQVNVLLFVMDFIIETPFKMLVDFFEKTMSFIHDKREEISE